MGLIAIGLACFAALGVDSGIGLVVVGLLIAGLGQGFAYNLSNTAGMESMPDSQAGVASGVLQTSRLMGIVIGLAISGALFRGLENDEMFSRFAAAGETLTGSEKETVRGLLSGSEAARTQLGKLAPTAKDAVDSIVDAAFVRGQRGVMVLGVVLCGIGVWTALWGRARVARTREKRAHRVAHGFSHAHYQPAPAKAR
jgi:hypothetical protein